MKKVLSILTASSLLLSAVSPTLVLADSDITEEEETVLEEIEENETINLYEDQELENIVLEIQKEDKVVLKEVINEEIILVEYFPDKQNLDLIEDQIDKGSGYIGYILLEELSISFNLDELKLEEELNILSEDGELEENYEEVEKEIEDQYDSVASEEVVDEKLELEDFEEQEERMEREPQIALASLKTYNGIAIANRTNVYESRARSSKVLRSYTVGSTLIYRDDTSSDWYQATVIISGKKFNGFIHKNDVEVPTNSPKNLQGIGLTSPTKVYKSPNTTSGVWRSYSQGAVLRYQTFTKDWYKATVIIGGKKQTGYIHKNDVEEPTSSPQNLRGIGLTSPTKVYKSPNTASGVWRSYSQGAVLRYQTFTKDWYKATVIIGGKKQTGYIHKNDVEEPTSSPQNLRGIGLKSPTKVYKSPNTASGVWRSYSQGAVLRYQTFTKDWYKATVIIGGKKQTGYIHKNDVEEPTSSPQNLQGIALNSTTNVYKSSNTSSGVWKSYRIGTVLKYRTFTKGWHEATVIIGGKKQTGYIRSSDVKVLNGRKVVIDAGHGGKDPGSSGHGLEEKDYTLKIALQVEELLTKAGFEVLMTRTTDKYLSLKERTDFANKNNADIMVSIHVNSFTSSQPNGIETWYMSEGPQPKESKELAEFIQSEVIGETKVNDRGTKNGNLHINRESEMASALIETGFISNEKDAENLKNHSFIKKIVKGIYNGIIKFFSRKD